MCIRDRSREAGRMVSPEFIIDAIETAIEQGKWVVRPGSAGFMVLWRRLFPGLLWWAIEKSSKPKR